MDEAQERINAYYTFSREEIAGPDPDGLPPGVAVELPPDMVESDTVALIHDETDGLGFYADFGLVEEAFADPGLLKRSRWRDTTLSYLHDDSVEPMVLRRLADRDPEKATTVFRRLLKQPRFDWTRDADKTLRELKQHYYAHPPRPKVSPVSDRLATFVKSR